MTETNSIKICGGCKVNKALAEFNKNKNRPDGLAWDCKECNKARCRISFNAKRAKYNESSRRDYENNKDAYKERAARWAQENREKRREISKKIRPQKPRSAVRNE